MLSFRRSAIETLARFGPRFLPFADAASPEVPLSRLLRLSLFQVTVGMALVLLVGTLNRVMIVELDVPASIVGLMLALPLVFAPFRALIGYRSDTHRSALGWRRVPFIWKGTLLQWGGFAIMPMALVALSGQGYAAEAPRWLGVSSAALAFLMVGAGVHMVQTVGLALATDLVKEQDQPKVVGLMYVMLLVGMIVSAFAFGALLDPFSHGRLIQVIQGAAVVTIALNAVALWKQEARDRLRAQTHGTDPGFAEAWSTFAAVPGALRLLVVIALGTAGFGMADVLLEPYGGQALGLSVAATTRLTAVLAAGGLAGFTIASRWLGRGHDPTMVAGIGAFVGVPAFAGIILSSYLGSHLLFVAAILLAGLGGGLFGHATLTASMRAAPRDQVGLALGAWGAVQATAAGLAVALAGLMRDAAVGFAPGAAPQTVYIPVFALEAALLVLALMAALPLLRGGARREGNQLYVQR